MNQNIKYLYITTKAGNTLQVFYNPDNDLLVIDLIRKDEKGGNEIVRMTLDEKKLLNFKIPAKKKPVKEKVWKQHLQEVYSSFEEWDAFSDMYGLANRLGYAENQEAWDDNPLIQGSTNPYDYKKV